jgi:hypothetical protein
MVPLLIPFWNPEFVLPSNEAEVEPMVEAVI